MEYKLVVVAKGSEVAKKAIKKALEIAKNDGIDEMHLIFVNDTSFYSKSGYVNLERELEQGIENISRVVLSKLEKIVSDEDDGIKVSKIELKGKTAKEILKFVKTNKVKTLVIPKEERGPIEKSLTHGDIEPFFNEIKQNVENFIVIE